MEMKDLEKIADSIYKDKFLDRDYYKNYYQMFFSVFDHWLTDEEAERNIVIYQEIEAKKDSKISKMYYEQEEKILNFFREIFQNFSLYSYRSDSKEFLKIEREEILVKNCLDAIRNDKFSIIYLAGLDIFFRGNYDFTFIMYMKDKDKIMTIKKFLDKHCLYVLS